MARRSGSPGASDRGHRHGRRGRRLRRRPDPRHPARLAAGYDPGARPVVRLADRRTARRDRRRCGVLCAVHRAVGPATIQLVEVQASGQKSGSRMLSSANGQFGRQVVMNRVAVILSIQRNQHVRTGFARPAQRYPRRIRSSTSHARISVISIPGSAPISTPSIRCFTISTVIARISGSRPSSSPNVWRVPISTVRRRSSSSTWRARRITTGF